jgi:hypothetical protein
MAASLWIVPQPKIAFRIHRRSQRDDRFRVRLEGYDCSVHLPQGAPKRRMARIPGGNFLQGEPGPGAASCPAVS